MKIKTKLLHINSYYISGGFYYFLFEKLISIGYDIKVFVPAVKGRILEHKNSAEYIDISNDFLRIDRFFFYKKHKKIYHDLLEKYTNVNKYDIVHAHTLFSNGYIAYKLKKDYAIPYIVAVRGTDVTFFFQKMFYLKKLGIQILEEASKIIFISPAHKKTVFELYLSESQRAIIEKKTVVIPNGIDSFWLKNKANGIKQKHDTLRLIYVGEINDNKNVVLKCEAIQRLVHEGMKISYSIVGKISNQKIYNKICKFRFVEYLGEMSKERLIDVYRTNDIFIMVSKSETFGLVYAEALTQGLPLIYSKGQGFDGFFNEGYVGYSAVSIDKNSISKAIRKVAEEYDRLALNCVEASSQFSWDEISRTYDQIYENIM